MLTFMFLSFFFFFLTLGMNEQFLDQRKDTISNKTKTKKAAKIVLNNSRISNNVHF